MQTESVSIHAFYVYTYNRAKQSKRASDPDVRLEKIIILITHPGTPPDSMWLASVTSSLHTSNCHFLRPSTPHNTFPVCMPIRMSTLNPAASLTNLFTRNTQNIYIRTETKLLRDGERLSRFIDQRSKKNNKNNIIF